jgi:hypothetical protein
MTKLFVAKTQKNDRRMTRNTRLAAYNAKPRLYVSIDDEGKSPIQDILSGARYNRPNELYRTMLPEIFKALGFPEGVTAKWSQKAGCQCPCSPGFVLTFPGAWPRADYWADLTTVEPQQGLAPEIGGVAVAV